MENQNLILQNHLYSKIDYLGIDEHYLNYIIVYNNKKYNVKLPYFYYFDEIIENIKYSNCIKKEEFKLKFSSYHKLDIEHKFLNDQIQLNSKLDLKDAEIFYDSIKDRLFSQTDITKKLISEFNDLKIKNIIKLYKYNEFEDLTDIFKLNPDAIGLQLFIDDNEYTTECFKRPPINNHYPVFYFEYEKHYHLLDIMFYSNEAKNSNCPEFMMYMKKYDDGGYDKKTKIKIRDLYIKIIKTAIKLFNKIYEIYPGFFYGGIDHNFFYLTKAGNDMVIENFNYASIFDEDLNNCYLNANMLEFDYQYIYNYLKYDKKNNLTFDIEKIKKELRIKDFELIICLFLQFLYYNNCDDEDIKAIKNNGLDYIIQIYNKIKEDIKDDIISLQFITHKKYFEIIKSWEDLQIKI